MPRIPKQPLLPGHVIPDCLRTDFHLSRKWNMVRGTPILVEKEHCDLLYETRDKIFTKSSLYPPHSESQTPDWLSYDRKILCFSAYARWETAAAGEQIRQAKILFYLEDSSIQVIEPRAENSGLPQGCIVSRQQVPFAGDDCKRMLSVLDFNVQHTVTIFGVDYVLVDCDVFTRKFLERAGIEVPQPIPMPLDRAQTLRQRMDESAPAKRPPVPQVELSKMERFLHFDAKVLKFEVLWDDRESLNGYVHELILSYYLVDDTIKIDSPTAPKKFLSRQRLPKHFDGMPMLGQQTNFTVLNVLGGGFLTGRFLADRQGVGSKKIEYVTDKDLKIGATLDVYGRTVLLTDCDSFTREHYRTKYGIEEMPPLDIVKPSCDRPNLEYVERKLPPFNGWGSHEDSEGNCKAIEPKAPLASYTKLLRYGSSRLRFGAKMVSDTPANAARSFLIIYYLSDDTISVYETDGRNSGFKTGEFYKRRKFLQPNQDVFISDRPKLYESNDLYIGATVCLKDFYFNLTGADEFTLQHMETHPFEYPMANIDSIMQKIRTAVKPQYKEFVAKYLAGSSTSSHGGTFVNFSTMRNALADLLATNITDHEIVTFLRHFAVESPSSGRCGRNVIRSLVHLDLNRNLWNDMARLKEHIYHLYPSQMNGFVPEKELQTIVKACRLPLSHDLICKMCSVLYRNEQGEIDVQDFLRFVDNLNHKAAAIQPANLYELCHKNSYFQSVQLIDWNRFIEKLDLEDGLKQQTD